MEYHPDKCRGEIIEADRAFKRIKEAYDILSNPESKDVFDKAEKLNVTLVCIKKAPVQKKCHPFQKKSPLK